PVVGVAASGREFQNLPNSLVEVLVLANPSGVRLLRGHQRTVIPTAWTLSGGQILTLQVEADERDKAGAIPMPTAFPGLSGIGSLFEELYRFSGTEGAGPDTGDDTGDGDDEATLGVMGSEKGDVGIGGDKGDVPLGISSPYLPLSPH